MKEKNDLADVVTIILIIVGLLLCLSLTVEVKKHDSSYQSRLTKILSVKN